MSQAPDSDPMPAIRGVFLAGCAASVLSGLLCLLGTGHLGEAVLQNPVALFGGFLCFGLVGTAVGGASGLSVRLLMQNLPAARSWATPVIVGSAASAAIGLAMALFLTAAVWGN